MLVHFARCHFHSLPFYMLHHPLIFHSLSTRYIVSISHYPHFSTYYSVSRIQVSKYPSIQVSKYPSIQVSKYPSIQVSKYPSIQVSKYPSIQVSKHPSIQASKHPSIHQQPPIKIIFILTRNRIHRINLSYILPTYKNPCSKHDIIRCIRKNKLEPTWVQDYRHMTCDQRLRGVDGLALALAHKLTLVLENTSVLIVAVLLKAKN